MSVFRRVGLLLAGAIASSLLVALPVAPAHADYDLGVTWPDVSAINPDTSTYRISVVDSGPGDLYADWGYTGQRQPIPHVGSAEITFPWDGYSRVTIWRCVDALCEWAGVSSPMLSVHRSLNAAAQGTATYSRSPGSWTVRVWDTSFPGLTDFTRSWSIKTQADEEVSSGAVPISGAGDFDIPVPSGLIEGTYHVDITARGVFDGGELSSAPVSVPVFVDNTGPTIHTTLYSQWLLPFDGYYGVLAAKADVADLSYVTVDVVTEGGTFVTTIADLRDHLENQPIVNWDGRVDGEVVTPGLYRLRFSATDQLGNTSSALTDAFHVDLARVKLVTKRTVIPAAQSVYSKYVGKCSSLVSPSSHGWRDSLGYYSQTKCTSEKRNASVVLVWHAAWLPINSNPYAYERIRVEQFGGPAKSHAKGSYMVMGYINRKGKFSQRVQFNKGMGWHSAATLTDDFKHWFHIQDGRPFFVWSNGLTVGSRYDIKAFRLTTSAWALVEPDGSILEIPKRVSVDGPSALRAPPMAMTASRLGVVAR